MKSIRWPAAVRLDISGERRLLHPICISDARTFEMFKKVGMFLRTDLLLLPATLSPQLHHVLPANSPRSAHRKTKKPLQNAIPPRRENYKIYRERS
jgi:hypothetical protein